MEEIEWTYKAPEVKLMCTYVNEDDGYVRVDIDIQPPFVLVVYDDYNRHLPYKLKYHYLIDPDKAVNDAIDRGLDPEDFQEFVVLRASIPLVVTGFYYHSRAYHYSFKYLDQGGLRVNEITPQIRKLLIKEMQEAIQECLNPNYLVDMSKLETSNETKIHQLIEKAVNDGTFFRYNFLMKTVKLEGAESDKIKTFEEFIEANKTIDYNYPDGTKPIDYYPYITEELKEKMERGIKERLNPHYYLTKEELQELVKIQRKYFK